jgi:hypothetical protein
VIALRATRGRTYELTRHFLRHMFDNEWSASTGQWEAAATGLIALLAPVAMLLVRELDPMGGQGYYRRLLDLPTPDRFRAAVLADELSVLVLLSVLTGVVALFVWQSLFPSSRDVLGLAGLPVRPREIFTARLSAVAIFCGSLVIAMNILPMFVAPTEFGGRWAIDPSWIAAVVAQAAAGVGACAFVFFALVAIQGLILNLSPASWYARLSVWTQALLSGAMLLCGLRLWAIRDWPMATVHRIPEFAAWWPPVWFAGVRESLLGNRDGFWNAMAQRGEIALATVVTLSLALYMVSYGRYRKLLLEGPSRGDSGRARRWSQVDLLSRDPRQRAILHFMAVTLSRSRTHRTIWLAYLGGAAAILINSSIVDGALWMARRRQAGIDFLVLFWPLACTVVLLPGMRHAMRIPSELRAHWVFRMHEASGRAAWMSAVERFVILYTVLPIYLLLVPASVYLHGWMSAARMTLLQVFLSLTFFEILFQSWQQLPFTCSYRPGSKPLVVVISGYGATLGALVPVLSIYIAAAGKSAILFWILFPFLGGLWLKLHRGRREGWGEAQLMYEDKTDAVIGLGIGEIRGQSPVFH